VPGTVSIPDPEYVKWWIEPVGIASGEGLPGYADFLSKIDSRPYLEQIRIPMLILTPARSVTTKLEEQNLIQAKVADPQLVVIHGTSHEIYVEMAEECQRAVYTFLSHLSDIEF
jgi:pimeloyl-ACP methyl ester carboxylesterase